MTTPGAQFSTSARGLISERQPPAQELAETSMTANIARVSSAFTHDVTVEVHGW